ncbi:MAG: type VI secretion system tip protein VgrG [Burkholderiales bacterium]|nr:type VI secretion system tip protein VgrG [Burkholderiales bacterium]
MDMLGGAAAEATISIKAKEGNYYVMSMIGHEHLGQMYEYVVELAEVPEESLNPLSEPEPPDLAKLIGTAATVSLNLENSDSKRYFYGYVTKAKRGEKRGRYTIYTITLRPGIWFMTQSKDSKVFQEKSVKEVITEILQEYSIDAQWDITETYPKLDYCVQYNETDFDFVHRLLEEAGIYYHFEHDDDAHKMVLKDSIASHEAYPSDSTIKWRMAMSEEPTITAWYMQQEVRTAETILTEYDFLAPATKNEGTAKAKEPPEMLGKMDWFEHPARVVQNAIKPDAQPVTTPIKQRATVRMEELQSCYASATGKTNVRDLALGMTFDIENESNSDDDGTYVMVSAIYRIDFGGVEGVDELKSTSNHEGYTCDFLCVSKKGLNYRTPRVTPRPVIAGPQTAIVVGTSGKEIETDKHGRIKIQFHWDRLGKNDQNSSCWVRVAQPWAGKGYGMFTLPRVKDEVVVQFLDGDPDRPLVMGAVYNNVNMMAWKLPEQATLTGFKSRTSDGGSEKTANELRFDDKKDKEYIWFHAERDFHRQVEHDSFDWVGNNESVKVTLTRKEAIGKNWFVDVTEDVMHNFGKDLHVNVAGDIFYTGEATFQLKLTKDLNVKSDGDVSIEASGKITLKAASIILEGSSAVTLKSGGSTVNLAGAGVDIVGSMVKVNSGGGGAGASPGKVDKAKKEDSITPEKKSDYEDTFKDPLPDSDGGTGKNNSKAS